jgi:putative spermidine/putrescine transport system permease protein
MSVPSFVTSGTPSETASGESVAADSPVVKRARFNRSWWGLAPFIIYTFALLLLPAAAVLFRAFRTETGSFTLQNVRDMGARQYVIAFRTSITLSLLSAFVGVVFGGFLAYSVLTLKRPKWLRSAVLTFSGLGSQFGGVPLAFIFIATLGVTGMVTKLLNSLGWSLYPGFKIYSFTGLVIVYAYFQVPLMVIVITPAIEGLRKQWREAASNLGATDWQYWRHVGLPILMPSVLGAFVLLFANAFSAYATAAALTSGQVGLVPVKIGSFLRGNVTASNSQLGQALATGMLVVVVIAMALYLWLQKRAARWAK